MSTAAQALSRAIRRVISVQTVIVLVCVTFFWVVRGGPEAVAALYGGAVPTLISAWLGYRMQRAGPDALGAIFVNAIARYVTAVMLLALGLGILKLAPLPLVLTFVAAQLGYLATMRGS